MPVKIGTQKTFHLWRCPCGARSREGWFSESDALMNAERHNLREGVNHPFPEISSDERIWSGTDWIPR